MTIELYIQLLSQMEGEQMIYKEFEYMGKYHYTITNLVTSKYIITLKSSIDKLKPNTEETHKDLRDTIELLNSEFPEL